MQLNQVSWEQLEKKFQITNIKKKKLEILSNSKKLNPTMVYFFNTTESNVLFMLDT